MTGRFTFILTERDISVMLDAVEAAVVSPPPDTPWCRDDYAELGAALQDRLRW